jgi:hypothetical protein
LLNELKQLKVPAGMAVQVAWFLADSSEPEWRDPAAAREFVTQQLSQDVTPADRYNLHIALAAAQMRAGDYPTCIESLDQATNIVPTLTTKGFFIRAIALHHMGNAQESQVAFDQGRSRITEASLVDERRLLEEAKALIDPN